jgi:SWI/SNF-related matrix-associated actin-dependent regulator 1 of chromatin subfamily A
VLVGNIDAAGVGFTLTAARHIIVAELPWTPGALQQVEDRLHRIGQTREVISTIVLAETPGGSIDERLWGLLDSKASVIGAVLDGDDSGLMVDTHRALLDSYA